MDSRNISGKALQQNELVCLHSSNLWNFEFFLRSVVQKDIWDDHQDKKNRDMNPGASLLFLSLNKYRAAYARDIFAFLLLLSANVNIISGQNGKLEILIWRYRQPTREWISTSHVCLYMFDTLVSTSSIYYSIFICFDLWMSPKIKRMHGDGNQLGQILYS